ncbi:MAG: hypothetical protein ACQETE_03440 [Bacteroidota bacterium]
MRFVFDANLSKYIPRALSVIQQRLNKRNHTHHQVKAVEDLFDEEIKDPDLFRALSDDDVLITFDINQQRKWQEKVVIDQERVNVIYFRLNNNLGYWPMVRLFFNSWEEVLLISDQNSTPFLHRFKPREVRKHARL